MIKNKYNAFNDLIDFILKLFHERKIQEVFKKWKILVSFKNTKDFTWLKLIYQREWEPVYELDYEIKDINTKLDKEKVKYTLQEFLLNVYYYYEWDWKPVTLEELAKILGVIFQAVDQEIKIILQKMRKQAKGIIE